MIMIKLPIYVFKLWRMPRYLYIFFLHGRQSHGNRKHLAKRMPWLGTAKPAKNIVPISNNAGTKTPQWTRAYPSSYDNCHLIAAKRPFYIENDCVHWKQFILRLMLWCLMISLSSCHNTHSPFAWTVCNEQLVNYCQELTECQLWNVCVS